MEAEYTITRPSASSISVLHASDTSKVSMLRDAGCIAVRRPARLAVCVSRLRIGGLRDVRHDERAEALAARFVIAELVEARAGRGQQHRVARLPELERAGH